jgi:hypothetical protein
MRGAAPERVANAKTDGRQFEMQPPERVANAEAKECQIESQPPSVLSTPGTKIVDAKVSI